MCAARLGIVERYAEFGSNDDMVTKALQGLSQQFLVIVRPVGSPVHFCRIEKKIAHFHGIGQQCRHFVLVCRSAIGMAHAHAA